MSTVKEEKLTYHGDQATRVTFLKPDPRGGPPRTDTTIYVDGCAYCESERDKEETFFPDHHASSRCESGKRPHCTCDTCF